MAKISEARKKFQLDVSILDLCIENAKNEYEGEDLDKELNWYHDDYMQLVRRWHDYCDWNELDYMTGFPRA